MLPFAFGATREEIGDAVDLATTTGSSRMPVLPLIITAEITDPDGTQLQARFAPQDARQWEILRDSATQTVRLRDFEVMSGAMRPVLVGNPGDREWQDDKRWGFKHMATNKAARWFPEIPGEWRVDLKVETLPPPQKTPWPTFEEPLLISSSIIMTGEVTEWGPADKGMRARLVWSTGARTADTTPFAVQLKNEGKEALKYNYGGTTIAKIPQPMHFTLIVDGEEWAQVPRGVPLIVRAADGFYPHPVGAVRSIVVRAGFWHTDGKRLGEMPGSHTVEVLFHFRPSVWNMADTSIWHGKLPTPKITIDVPKAR